MSKGKVLIVDDVLELREAYNRIISNAGYESRTSKSAEEAWESIVQEKPDLILLDIALPGMSGLELLKKLKSNENTEDIFVVMISGSFRSSDDQSHGLEIGADGYLIKPIQTRELAARIDAFMKHKKTIDYLRISENRIQNIISKNADALLIIDKKGIIRFANPAAYSLFSSSDSLINRHFGYPLIKDKKSEIYIYGDEGFNRVAEMHIVEIEWEGEMVFLSSIRDITDRKIAEEALQKSEAFNRGILNSLSANIAVIDKNGKIVAINEAWKKFAQEYDGNVELLKEGDNYFGSCEKNATPEEIKKINEAIQGVKDILSGKKTDFEVIYPCHSEEEKRYYLMNAKPVIGVDNNLVISHVNITEQKVVEDELKIHKERLETLVKERTKELEKKIEEVEKFNDLFIGREFRIKELKEKNKELLERISYLENQE
jgi:CheY-like chemotaxis protein